MIGFPVPRRPHVPALAAVLIVSVAAAFSFQIPQQPRRFDALVLPYPATSPAPAALDAESLAASDPNVVAWRSFLAARGQHWEITLDRRSGAPLLVQGDGIPWIPGSGNSLRAAPGEKPATLDTLSVSLREFIAENVPLFRADGSELVLNRDGSGQPTPDLWQIEFDRSVSGVRVDGDRYVFYIGHGNLIAFGATRWSAVPAGAKPALSAAEARAHLYAYMGLTGSEEIEIVDPGTLMFIPLPADGGLIGAGARTGDDGDADSVGGGDADPAGARDACVLGEGATRSSGGGHAGAVSGGDTDSSEGGYAGPVGAGYAPVLTWRFALRVAGDSGTWVGLVKAGPAGSARSVAPASSTGPADSTGSAYAAGPDGLANSADAAHAAGAGRILAFYDSNHYAQVKGGVLPVSNDGICPDGCEQGNYPMPFADISIGGAPQTASTMGRFSCVPGGAMATTTLSGPYVTVSDRCGAVSEPVGCDTDLDLQSSPGTDCAVPPGKGSGDTHAARTGFYHLNRIKEHARVWFPLGHAWLNAQLLDNVNIGQHCNAYWDDNSVNFYKSGGGCRNTGEISAVFLHEWGHGMDANDGGGYDNPSEAYADISAFLVTHDSCAGRGFYQTGVCGGYGNVCLACSGIRDMDWDRRANHVPSTPSGFLATYCRPGPGPCGKEEHCEGYVAGETIWDLAVRDLPGSGLDPSTSWQLTDRLWYQSRLGSGGNAYTCSLPSSNGCGATSWFTRMRVVDDDDGNLANGTPHAASLFSAFNRHKIACGLAADPSNQSASTCPPMNVPVLSRVERSGTGTASLTWTGVTNAVHYRVLRNDSSCAAGHTVIATVPGTAYLDSGLVDDFSEYYAVQAVGANSICESALSNCIEATPRPCTSTASFDRQIYACDDTIAITMKDHDLAGAGAHDVTIRSGTEPTAESVTLAEIPPGSGTFHGTYPTFAGPPAGGDGRLSVVDGDTITVRYMDALSCDTPNVATETSSVTDCAPPVFNNVHVSDIKGISAIVGWTTNEPSTSRVHYGTGPPGALAVSDAALVTTHSIKLRDLSPCTSYAYWVDSTDNLGNSGAADNGGSYYTFSTGANTQPFLESADTPVPIPDGAPEGSTSTITVPDLRPVLDVNVTVTIAHTWDADLAISLITPAGQTIPLSSYHGGSSDNYIGTEFDDEADTPISTGTAPFTGAYRPESPLSAADGILAAGNWTLSVVDPIHSDSGTLLAWDLELTYPGQTCGSHLIHGGNAVILDSCPGGGAGGSNGVQDAGETVRFSVTLKNDGTIPLSGVAATLTPLTPGVSMTDRTASFPDLAANESGDSLSPHFTVKLPSALACGSTVDYQVEIATSGGALTGTFSTDVGQVITGPTTALAEDFSAGIPGTWTVLDGGFGGGDASTWTAFNPGGRVFSVPLTHPVAMVDSDRAGPVDDTAQDEQLITPVMDLSAATQVTLEFDQYFRWFSGHLDEKGDVDVRSSRTGGAWVNVLRNRQISTANPDHQALDISSLAAGAADTQVRFHYYDAYFEWWWEIDNVRVTSLGVVGCSMIPCAAAAAGPPPVPDGTFGSPMTAIRANSSGSALQVRWDVATCVAPDYELLYGPLASVGAHSLAGAVCGLGTTGNFAWTGVPPGDWWFVVVADDGVGTEGSWGTDGSGSSLGGAASGQCGNTVRDNSASCP